MSVSSCRLWRGRGGSNEKGAAALAADAQGEALIGAGLCREKILGRIMKLNAQPLTPDVLAV